MQGEASDLFIVMDMVFQGTVLGPPLWNFYFADVANPAKYNGGKEAIFVDDLIFFV